MGKLAFAIGVVGALLLAHAAYATVICELHSKIFRFFFGAVI
jgi:hypothetical protein